MSASDPATPADTPPVVWWSPSMAASGRVGLIVEATDEQIANVDPWPGGRLPADAVRLVPQPAEPETNWTARYRRVQAGLPVEPLTSRPPTGSEHYREGWRDGYDQARIDRERATDAAALAGTTTPTGEEAEFVEEALRCADAGDAGHWPTAAGYLADEVRRLRSLLASTPTSTEETNR